MFVLNQVKLKTMKFNNCNFTYIKTINQVIIQETPKQKGLLASILDLIKKVNFKNVLNPSNWFS